MIPWKLIERVPTPDGRGDLSLHGRGAEYSIRVDGRELMNSRVHGSEEAMAELACASLPRGRRPRVLIGGLGMGFTLAATNKHAPADASVEVAELTPAVVAWNRGPLGKLAGNPLKDRRVRVLEEDVRKVLERSHDRYAAILLDVDNGPEDRTQASSPWLYRRQGLGCIHDALNADGILSVWSARSDERFTKRLHAAGFTAKEHRVRGRAQKGGAHHSIWIAVARKS